MKRVAGFVLSAVAGLAMSVGTLAAQDYPTKTVTLVVPFSPGGGTDLTGRIVADALTKEFGQSVIVENRPGAAAQIGIDHVAKAANDGYTLLWASADGITVLPNVKKTPYTIPDDFEYVQSFAGFPLILGVTATLPINNMEEFIAYAKAHPGEMTYASSGAGGGGHLQPAYMAKLFGLDMAHVPYDGAAPSAVAVAGGHSQFCNIAPSTIRSYVEAKTIRPIATSGRKRSVLFPDVPTMEELGYPELTEDLFYGLYAPAGTPAAIVEKLRAAVEKVVTDPETAKRLIALGLEPLNIGGEEFKKFVIADKERWGRIVKEIDFKLGG